MTEIRLEGRCAAPGFARGPIRVLDQRECGRAGSGGAAAALDVPAAVALDVPGAVAAARAELAGMAAGLPSDAAEMLGLQVAMLDDDTFLNEALHAIEGGADAGSAWRTTLDAEIAGYDAADDEVFRARAADLRDLRDRVLAHLAGTPLGATEPPGSVLVAADVAPSRFLAHDWSGGGALVLTRGSAASHVAMLARARGVPMIVGAPAHVVALAGEALVDAARGLVIVAPHAASIAAFNHRSTADALEATAADAVRHAPVQTADGTLVQVLLNVADPAELDALDPALCDGIGLVRTEFLFGGRGGLPDEAAQCTVYRRLVEWAAGRDVTVRTLDAGGDKPMPGLTIDGESNPFLGVRGLRLSFALPAVFRTQLRALARAAVYGPLRVMLPMVTLPQELAAARAMLDEEVAALRAAGVAAVRPPLGIMVEVPAAAIAADLFDADFYSIGSNDLTQYVAAVARDTDALAALADPVQPAVLRLIRHVVLSAQAQGRPVSLCGDAGGDPAAIGPLLGAGLRSLSMAPARVGRAKLTIARTRLEASPR